MTAKPTTVVSIPRFLLPQLTWRAPHLHPAATIPASSLSPRRQQRRQGKQLHTSAAQRHLQNSKLEWRTLSRNASSRDPQTKLTKSLYRALQASLQQPAASSLSGRSNSSTLPRNSLATSTPLPPLPSSAFTGSVLQSHAFHTSRALQRDHHFDTLKFVQRLKDEGFSEAQATAMMRVLSDVIEEAIQNLTRTMVLREDAERATYTQKVDFTKLRSELLSADNAEASLTRASHDRLANDLAKISSRLRDEIGRTQASVRLDLNLEKGRIREEANVQELKIKETEARIEQEVAGLRERVEGVKFGTLQWLMGVCTGTAAIILGAWRLFM